MTDTTQLSRPGRVGWLLVLLTLATALLPVPSSAAADTICVALVVDFSPLGGSLDSGCTRVPSGASGYDVLKAGGHTYTVCNNGVIGEIDQQPPNGCQIKDNNHFWGYWHRKPGSRTWTFSSYGAGFYHPVEGSTDGWVWEDGSTAPPPDVAYPADCHSPPRTATPTPARHSARPTASATLPPTTRAVAAPASQPTATPATPATRSTERRPDQSARATPSRTTTPTASAEVDARSTPHPAAAPTQQSSGGRHAAPLAIGLGAAALLGAGAWWRVRGNGAS